MHRTLSHTRRGFTIVELMIVLAIIAILTGLVFAAIGKVKGSADVTSERAMLSSLKQGVEHHKELFGYPPPLVLDAAPGPVNAMGVIQVWGTRDLSDPMTTLNGSTGPEDRQCHSEYSLSYYLAGSLGDAIDGVEGLGFTAPNKDGSFSGKGRKYEAMIDPTRFKTRGGQIRAFEAPGSGAPPTSPPLQRAVWHSKTKIYDRWSNGSAATDKFIRYYRWEPSFYTPAGGADPAPSPADVGSVHYWNVPIAIGGDLMNAAPPTNAEIKSARWAIVAAGPDRKFGDEASLTAAERAQAVKDNIVEVGR